MKLSQPERSLNPLHMLIVDLAGRPGGLNNAELREAGSITAEQAASALHCAARWGRTMSVEHPGDKDHRRRYFTSRAAADAWLAGPAPARIEYQRHILRPKALRAPKTAKTAKTAEKAPQGHKWRPDALTAGSSKMASSAASEPASGPKITIGPSPIFGVAARYYVDPATVHGPFETAGIGRDFTGRPWGAA